MERAPDSATVVALHHGYRVAGGEERVAEQLALLAEQQLGERIAWVRRDSSLISAGPAARGLLRGGLDPDRVKEAVERTGADLVHAHNLFPTFGPAALRAAADAGAATVAHLHNSRLVCAVGTNVRDGHDCTECSAGRPLPGILHRCRGSLPEAIAYGAALPKWLRGVFAHADLVIVPSEAAAERFTALGMPLTPARTAIVGGVCPLPVTTSVASAGRYALIVGRLAPEKDHRTAIDACRIAGIPLVVAGDGPELPGLQLYAGEQGGDADPRELLGDDVLHALPAQPAVAGNVVFAGRVGDAALAMLRAGARIALVTSLAHETFGLAAMESMAAALPTAGSAVGALPGLIGPGLVAPPGDAAALAMLIDDIAGDDAAGVAAAKRAWRLGNESLVAGQLGEAYTRARELARARRATASPA